MKEKNLPDDNNLKSLEQLEKEKDLENSLDNYQKLIKLNNIIEKRFQKKFKKISQLTKDKIIKIINSKNET